MIRKKKIGAFAFAFILATGLSNLDAGRGVSSMQRQKPFLSQGQADKNQIVVTQGLFESIKENGLTQGLKLWWNGPQVLKADKVESAKGGQAHKLLEREEVALQAKHEIEKNLEQETNESKKAWLRSQLETLKQFIVDNKKALGALGALAVAAGTAAYFAPAKGEKSAEGLAGQGAELGKVDQTPETGLQPSGTAGLVDKEALSLSPDSSTNVQVKPTGPTLERRLGSLFGGRRSLSTGLRPEFKQGQNSNWVSVNEQPETQKLPSEGAEEAYNEAITEAQQGALLKGLLPVRPITQPGGLQEIIQPGISKEGHRRRMSSQIPEPERKWKAEQEGME